MSDAVQPDEPWGGPKSQETALRQLRRRSAPEHIFHLAEGENLHSIFEQGLMSTAKLLARHGLPDQEKIALLRGHRSTHLRLQGILIRDQVPMPPAALAPALDDGMEPSKWYALVNEHVFFWPDRERLNRHLKACGSRLQYLMTFNAAKLFRDFGDQAFVSPINSGNARRKPARRGRDTFVPYRMWIEHGWTTGQRRRPPAEFLFRCNVPAKPPYLTCVEKL
ncbi:DUF7002 family protein [Lichenicoccus sp.]|uniref:DUF7002 family protein n=1 Tax=Lichenicoccus sp. TaxID=2781899 RepID=UPI003D1290DE